MKDFKAIGIAAITGGSKLTEGRTKITTEEIIKTYGGKVRIMGFDLAEGRDGAYCIVLLDEAPDRYYNGGKMLTEIVSKWVAAYDGDIDTASADLKEANGCPIIIEQSNTKAGRRFVRVSFQ